MRRLFSAALVLVLAGCGASREFPQAAPSAKQIRVDWLGNESFLFTSAFGAKVLTNPYSAGTGFGSFPSNVKPDVLLITTEAAPFNNDSDISNSPTVFRGAVGVGLNNSAGTRIRGLRTNPNGAGSQNILYAWSMNGVRICFAGNIENPLTPDDIMLIGAVDLLFLPAGVPSGLSDSVRSEIIAQLRPRLVVPMGSYAAMTSWANSYGRVYRAPGTSVRLSRDELPTETSVLLFSAR